MNEMFASWFDPSTLITDPNVTGMLYAARKTMITPTLAAPPVWGRNELHVGSKSPRIAAPFFAPPT